MVVGFDDADSSYAGDVNVVGDKYRLVWHFS